MAASIIGNLVGGNLFSGLASLINSIRGKNPADADLLANLAAKYQSDIVAADTAARQSQADVNKTEAASPKVFIAGWRPFIGWVCGIGLLVQFIVNPIATWIAALCGKTIAFPSLDLGTLITLLFGMLGLGAMRTYEKVQGAPGADQLQ